MDALTILAAFLSGGLGGAAAYAVARGERPPTQIEIWQTLQETSPLITKTYTIDITEAHDNQEFLITGTCISVVNPEDPSVPVYIRFNDQNTEAIDLTKQRNIKAPFWRFFITNAVGTGTLTLIVNKFSEVSLEPASVNVNVVAQALGTLAVDIVAQSVGNLAIDIAAQSLGALAVDLTAQSIGNLAIDITAQTIGNIDINIATQAGNLNINIADSDIQVPVDIQGQTIDVDVNLVSIAGTALSAANWTTYLSRLNVNLSTIASQATLASILAQLDVALSTVATQATLASILAKLDVNLSVVATQATLATRASDTELAKKVNKATTPAIYNVEITNADTEYSQALPANTKRFLIQTRDGTSFRLAFETGKVATPTEPYLTQPANTPYSEGQVEPSSLTLYFACAVGSKNAEIVAWS